MPASDDDRTAATPREPARKDRLIQTRVPRELEATLKEEARRRRLSLSHLIRNALEDTFQLVDGVVADVDQLVNDSVHLARNVQRNARRLASPSREPAPDDDLAHVYAWNEVVLQRPGECSKCGTGIARGERGFAGLSDEPGAPRAWLCADCIDALADPEAAGSG